MTNQRVVSKIGWLIFSLIAAATAVSFFAVRAAAFQDSFLRVYFLNVGQGDAIFIQAPNGNQALIDGGPDGKIIQELSKIMPFHDRSIDLLILTHPHADHVNGLLEVLKRYDIAQVLENYYPYETPEYAEWNKLKTEAQTAQAQAGQIVDLGLGIKMFVVYPDQVGAGQVKNNPNDASVVLKLVYGQNSLLLGGDIEAPVEKKLVATGADLDSDFLKIAHHGSKTSTAEEFLEAVTPELAFIQVGADNRYGHPHQIVLDRLESLGVKYYRTDINGTIELMLDGQSYFVEPSRQ